MNIPSLVDRCLVAFIINGGAGTEADVVPAKRSDVKSLPITVCYCHSFQPCEGNPFSGNFDAEAFIEVRSSGVIEEGQSEDDPRQAADDRTASTFGLFYVEPGAQSSEALSEAITLAGRSSGAEDLQNFTVQSCMVVRGEQGFNSRVKEQRGNAWIDTLHLQLSCCTKDVL